MKIRTLTYFFPYQENNIRPYFDRFETLKIFARQAYADQGFEIQTFRIATNIFVKENKNQVKESAKHLQELCQKYHIEFCSIGRAEEKKHIEQIPEILRNNQAIFCSAFLGNPFHGVSKNIESIAKVVLKNAEILPNGMTNFRFSAFASPVLTPFFPVASFESEEGFALGFENSDLLYQAFRKEYHLKDFKKNLIQHFQQECFAIEKIAFHIAQKSNEVYLGIDNSMNPSLSSKASISTFFENFGIQFGNCGTLAICETITSVLKNIAVKKVGYCGLMLPILEDVGLAQLAKENRLSISELLLFSSVCGTGLDCVPIAGNISPQKIEWLYRDVAQMSIRLSKPLSVRIFPIAGKKEKELTEFASPYLINTRIFSL